jgi:hypothetical protein
MKHWAMLIIPLVLNHGYLIAQVQQTPPIGVIDFYGLRTISEEEVSQAFDVKKGDTFPASRSDWGSRESAIVERLEGIPGVVKAWLQPICCMEGKTILFVGIEEKDAPHFEYRIPPDSAIALSQEIIETYRNWENALGEAIRKGDAVVDPSQGHALSANAETRAFEERFIVYAEKDLEPLRQVLRHSANAEQRAMATQVIAYAQDKRTIVDDLLYATRDSDSTVRNNAMYALAIIVEFAQDKPELDISISPTPFIEMLNSIMWTDRNKATMLLNTLTVNRDAALLQQIREQAFPSLVEMARWKSMGHANGPFRLLGRVAGLSEQEINNAMGRGGKMDTVIAQIVESNLPEK